MIDVTFHLDGVWLTIHSTKSFKETVVSTQHTLHDAQKFSFAEIDDPKAENVFYLTSDGYRYYRNRNVAPTEETLQSF